MGFIREKKAEHVGADARAAREAGMRVFAARLNTPALTWGVSGSIKGWAEMIESIEAEGWVLQQWAAAVDSKGNPEAYPLFRRA